MYRTLGIRRIGTLVSGFTWAGLLAVVSCYGESPAPTEVRSVDPQTRPYINVCWPPGPGCEDRLLTTNEKNKVTLMGMAIQTAYDPRCEAIQSRIHQDNNQGDTRYWENAPSYYFGDQHPEIGITHLTASAFANNAELMKTLIHEAAHAIYFVGDNSDLAEIKKNEDLAYELETTCMGNPDF